MKHIQRLLCVLAVVTQLEVRTASASTPLSALTIRLTDLRPGYLATDVRHRTSTTLATRERIGAPLLLAHGWADGFDALYQRQDNHLAQVGESADRFKTADGAHWWYEVSVLRVPPGYRSVQSARVGDESVTVQSSAFVGLIFRRNQYVMDVYVSTHVPSALSAVLALAQLTDRRLQQDQARAAESLPARSRGLQQQARTSHSRTAAHQNAVHHGQNPPRHTRVTTHAQAAVHARVAAHPKPATRDKARPAIQVWVQPNPMSYLAVATLYARTAPGAVCTDSVKYATRHPSPPFGGYRLIVGSSGVASWSWHNQVTGVHGRVTVTCTIRGQLKTASAPFTTTG